MQSFLSNHGLIHVLVRLDLLGVSLRGRTRAILLTTGGLLWEITCLASILLLRRRILSRLALLTYASASHPHIVSLLINVYERIRMRQNANKCFEALVEYIAAVRSQAPENERRSLEEAQVEVCCNWVDCIQAVHKDFAVDWLWLAAAGAV